MGLVLVTAPATEPVTLVETKAHLRVDITDDDVQIGSLVTAAREQLETDTRRALVTQTWDLVLDAFPREAKLELPLPPLASVTSITYKDADGITQTFPAGNYVVAVSEIFGRIVLKSGFTWPSTTLWSADAVAVRFVAGYGGAAAVPQTAKQAILLLVGHWYENREAVVVAGVTAREVPMGYERLMWLLRPSL
jgi:uncharacterized phiE125 gp8 family phage protein